MRVVCDVTVNGDIPICTACQKYVIAHPLYAGDSAAEEAIEILQHAWCPVIQLPHKDMSIKA